MAMDALRQTIASSWFQRAWIIIVSVALVIGLPVLVMVAIGSSEDPLDGALRLAVSVPISVTVLWMSWMTFSHHLTVAYAEAAWITGLCPRWSARYWLLTLDRAGNDAVMIDYLASFLRAHLVRRWHAADRQAVCTAIHQRLAGCRDDRLRPALILMLGRLAACETTVALR
jgi:hypothetical protein